MNEKYMFFWSGPFSQWHPSQFQSNGLKYNCAEQYMMHQKALLFKDTKIASAIMKTTSPREQKALGRKVNNFNSEKWNNIAPHIVYNGNYAKFTQNKDLYDILMATNDLILVEASPYDKIWGIGLTEEQAIKIPPEHWPGKNWLVLVLTQLRDDFK